MKQNALMLSPRSTVHGPRKKLFWFFHWFLSIVYGLVILDFSGCATIPNSVAKQQERTLMNSAQEVLIGRSMSENIIKRACAPYADAAKQLFVNKIGQRIAQVNDRRDIIYHFMILDSPDLNAFALPGGYVYIYRGLMERLEEPQIAAVLAHEIGHVAARHCVKIMQASLGNDFLFAIALAGLNNKEVLLPQDVVGVTNTVFNLLSRGFSREEELSADRAAVRYLRAASYDPRALVNVLKILNKETGPGDRVFEILSTQARIEERIKKIEEEIKKNTEETPKALGQ